MSYLTTKETADKLGVSTGRVRQMILAGQLQAEKFGRDLMINETDIKEVSNRKTGRPKKVVKDSRTNGADIATKSFAEAAAKYIGCVDSGETDLGSNKKHLEGFGTKKAEKANLLKRG
jgi:excisionase family DNA binding protein